MKRPADAEAAKAQMFYREAAPSAALEPFVLSYWEFLVPDSAASPIDHEIFPDGCVSVFYHRNERYDLHRVGVSGLRLESSSTIVSAGDTFWGMRISPAACRGVLRCDPAGLLENPVPGAAEFPHLTAGLIERLRPVDSFDEAISVFDAAIGDLARAGIERDEKTAQAVYLIDQNNGEIRIDDLADRLHLSTRQLQRRFKASSGLSPKQFARIRRIRATAVILAHNDQVNWADRAAEMGFSDQSHLAREFVSVTKRSPVSFAKKVGLIGHGDLVK